MECSYERWSLDTFRYSLDTLKILNPFSVCIIFSTTGDVYKLWNVAENKIGDRKPCCSHI